MVNFFLSTSDNGDIYVYRRIYDLFGEVITPVGWFASYNSAKAMAFKFYLDNNPEGDLNKFFSIKMYEDKE